MVKGTKTTRSNARAWCSLWGWRARCRVRALRAVLVGLLDAGPRFAPASAQVSGQTAPPLHLFLARVSVIQDRSRDGLDFRRPAGKLALIGLDRLESCLCRCAAGSESWGMEQRCMLVVCFDSRRCAVEQHSS